jgi:hypothetical protein
MNEQTLPDYPKPNDVRFVVVGVAIVVALFVGYTFGYSVGLGARP